METDFFLKNEYEISRSDCSKLIFTTHRIIQQDDSGRFVSSVDLQKVSTIDRNLKRNKWYGSLAFIGLAGVATTLFMGMNVFYLIGVGTAALIAVGLFLFIRKEYIVIHTEGGKDLTVVSNCLKSDPQSLIGNLEAARFQRFNQSHKAQREPKKETKVVKITA